MAPSSLSLSSAPPFWRSFSADSSATDIICDNNLLHRAVKIDKDKEEGGKERNRRRRTATMECKMASIWDFVREGGEREGGRGTTHMLQYFSVRTAPKACYPVSHIIQTSIT